MQIKKSFFMSNLTNIIIILQMLYKSSTQSTKASDLKVPCCTHLQYFILGPDIHKNTFVWF